MLGQYVKKINLMEYLIKIVNCTKIEIIWWPFELVNFISSEQNRLFS